MKLAIFSALGILASATSFAMGHSSLVQVDTVQARMTLNYLPTMEMQPCTGPMPECDAGDLVMGPGCEPSIPMYKPSGRDALETIKSRLRSQGYTDEALDKLMVEPIRRGAIEFGGIYPSCTPSVEAIEWEAYLPKSLVKSTN